MPHFIFLTIYHIPIQHGSANILATKFTPLDPLQLVDKTSDEDVTVLSLKRQIQERQGLISMLDQAGAATKVSVSRACFSEASEELSEAVDDLKP